MIQIKNVTFSYSKQKALLSDLSLQLESGRIHGLLGKNGEGKSTLLKLMSGLVFPQSGSLDVMGFVPSKRDPLMLSEIFFLPEELPQLNISVANFEKVYAPFYPNFSSEQFNNFLNEFDVNDKASLLTKLSHGQKKKVMIAFGLATNTKLLLMDEPTNGLDIPSKGQFRRMVASVIDESRCLIISTHQVHDLDSLIDNIIIMEKHKIVFNQTLENIAAKLTFKVADRGTVNDQVIYSEDTLRGLYQVCKNAGNEDSKVDIELLFNAVLTNTNELTSVFNQ
ncbi:MAG: ABC transporter ATP-binding protein [Bacteroidia bacterium]|mgnify:CR=1 FL=1|jgi:ABC-2 type transport system ATP-binding protein|nr:ABC transporter ATP-binding protein [Paludibacter sp.]MDD3488424.1 ABC transporter ATP-binding protein [Paludibacter sp.]NCB68035.1 ABC transporter ATP-binding protein [Bacteroidia bacterium]